MIYWGIVTGSNIMNRTYLTIAALAAVLIVGCTQTVPNTSSGSGQESVTEYGLELQQKAIDLASAELARFNAVELLYRNIPMRHRITNPGTMHFDFGWVKLYRRFSDLDVKDVRRSDSLLTPIIFEVEFEYELYGTRFHRESEGPALEKTRTDIIFDILHSDTVTIFYGCNEEGQLVNSDQEYLPRPNYFQVDAFNEVVVGPAKPNSEG